MCLLKKQLKVASGVCNPMMSAAVRYDTPNGPPSFKADLEEEVLVNMIRKIAFIAACIDLHYWRTILDEVLREVEAEHEVEQPALEEADLYAILPAPAAPSGSAARPGAAS
jgi:hypothetical protein